LGHIQRGGTPTPYDRNLSTRFGTYAVKIAMEKKFGHMVSLCDGKIGSVPLADAVSKQKLVDPDGELVAAARAVGISFGD
ncbi:MAG TPA: 6-phosphofructokinase, partial [Firmicutes bacterium]|nr:6-phosphofructokinase [Bacillota bacterium]